MRSNRVMRLLVLCSLLFCIWSVPVTRGQDFIEVFDQDDSQQEQLTAIHLALLTIDDLEMRGVLSADEAEAQEAYYLAQASEISGKALTRETLEVEISSDGIQWPRILNFVNIIWVFAGIIIAISVMMIFVLYIWPIVRAIPVVVYEVLAYLAAFGFILLAGRITDFNTAQFAALPGNLLLAVLLLFTYFYHIKTPHGQPKTEKAENSKISASPPSNEDHIWTIYYTILTLVWGGTAVAYDSQLIGIMTVGAFLGILYTSGFLAWLVRVFSLNYDELVPMAIMLVSLGSLLIYIAAKTYRLTGVYTIFETGIFLVGTYGYFSSLEVLSSRWYRTRTQRGYMRWQVYALAAGLGGMLVGVLFELDSLTEASGTFMLIYLLTKYVEILDWKRFAVWGLLGFGVLLYCSALLINRYPEFFLLG